MPDVPGDFTVEPAMAGPGECCHRASVVWVLYQRLDLGIFCKVASTGAL